MTTKAIIYERCSAIIYQRYPSLEEAEKAFKAAGLGDGYAIAPADIFWKWIDYKVTRYNLQTGEPFEISVNASKMLDPSTESYWN